MTDSPTSLNKTNNIIRKVYMQKEELLDALALATILGMVYLGLLVLTS
jgi:hypothetical protein